MGEFLINGLLKIMKIVENKNMKILLIQENGRHEENRQFRECFSLQKSFNKLGHEATVWGLGHDNFNETPLWEEYDWIINLENISKINQSFRYLIIFISSSFF